MEAFIAQLEELIEASEEVSTAELIAALELTKQSLVLACLAGDEEDDAEA
jgi:hypothetical protein